MDPVPQAGRIDGRVAPGFADTSELPRRAARVDVGQEKLAENFEREPADGRDERLVIGYVIPFDVSSDAKGRREGARLAEDDPLKFEAFKFELPDEVPCVSQPLLYRQDAILRVINAKAGMFYFGSRW
jgi:hypothetical protein